MMRCGLCGLGFVLTGRTRREHWWVELWCQVHRHNVFWLNTNSGWQGGLSRMA